jgi:hypothetical protein
MAVQSDLEPHGLPKLIEKQRGDLQRLRHRGEIGCGLSGVGLKAIQRAEE